MERRWRDPDPAGAVERAVLFIISATAAIVVIAFVGLLLAIAFLVLPSKPAASAELLHVPQRCVALAEKYQIPLHVSPEQAEQIVEQLDRYSWWPGVRQCRKAVKAEWKK